jgi:SAM-dependent methyltransferase
MRTLKPAVPERLSWAVSRIAVRPGQRILEIGGGQGVAAALVCERLTDGYFLGLDRSATAAAADRNRQAVARGVADFRPLALEEADPERLGRFDTVFAVNVNLFWVRPAEKELRLIARILRPTGKLWLFYEPPRGEVRRLRDRLAENFRDAGYRFRTATRPGPRTPLLSVSARPSNS